MVPGCGKVFLVLLLAIITVSSDPIRKPESSVVSECIDSEYGCCPGGKTAASGPFDEGCPKLVETCNETKFRCCPDGVSPALGPDGEGCPVPSCSDMLYGCCSSDNKTAAEGNDQEGCPPPLPPCLTTMFGCCEDGKTTATGSDNAGCPELITSTTIITPTIIKNNCTGGCESVSSCNTSRYGCCEDGKTPAHGPDHEGCCLMTPYGCCPDNYKPAEGLYGEGCDCEYAHFGCCPDNKTIARGHNKEGCGCQYTDYGCCLDRHTTASGPYYDGCDCHTFQFGCCPDGVTVATGPNLQGCHCSTSKYGCCGDGETAASGPSQAGCDCSSSMYGCCADGISVAKGSLFYGCAAVPNNKQAACSLPLDRGSCQKFSQYWYYDIVYGGCFTFLYGGCEGNDNRFDTKEECENVCVHPPARDVCKLPNVKGPCVDNQTNWYYDVEEEQCQQFNYGGCVGNANNFANKDLCEKKCAPEIGNSQCNLPIERGPCNGTFGRWGFNKERDRCEQFIWGGCEGNSNRFTSEASCTMRCKPPKISTPRCSLPQVAGNCTEVQAMWSFSQAENQCVPFYYTGCMGNDNRFDSFETCTEACPSAYKPNECTLPFATGKCQNNTEKWYYDTTTEMCSQFYYGGCDGNSNNFDTREECEGRCFEPKTPNNTIDICELPVLSGPCKKSQSRWFYNATSDTCSEFTYGGCKGNDNRFETRGNCEWTCKKGPIEVTSPPETSITVTGIKNECKLASDLGTCKSNYIMWFYDVTKHECQLFNYSGCGGNNNRFKTQNDCMSFCRPDLVAATTPAANTILTSTPSSTIIPTTVAIDDGLPQYCHISSALEQCVGAGEVWYLDPTDDECMPHNNSDTGVSCRTTGVFRSEEACERSCGNFIDAIDVCHFPKDPGPYKNFVSKYYFDEESRSCKVFQYGGAGGGANRFSTLDECIQVCNNGSEDSSTTSTSTPSFNTSSSITTNSSASSSTTTITSAPSFSTTTSSISNSSTPSSITISSTTTSSSIRSSNNQSSTSPSSSTLSSITPDSSTPSSSIPSSSTPSSSISSSSTSSSRTLSSSTQSSITPSSSTPSSSTPSSSTPSSNSSSSSTPSYSTPSSITLSSITSGNNTQSSSIPSSSTPSSITPSSSTLSSSTQSSITPSSSTPSSSTPSSNSSSSSTPSYSTPSSITLSSITSGNNTQSSSIPSSSTPSSITPSSSTLSSISPSSITPSSSTPISSIPSSTTPSLFTPTSYNLNFSTPSPSIPSSSTPSSITISSTTTSSSIRSSNNQSSTTPSSSTLSSITPDSSTPSSSIPSSSTPSSSTSSSRTLSSSTQSSITPSSSTPSSSTPSSNTPSSNTPSSITSGNSSPSSSIPSSSTPSSITPSSSTLRSISPSSITPGSSTPSSSIPSSTTPSLFTPTSYNLNFSTPSPSIPSSSTPSSSAPSSSTTSTSTSTSTSTPRSSAPGSSTTSTSSSSTPSSIASTHSTTITTTTPGFIYADKSLPEVCLASPELEQCARVGIVWYLDPTSEKCVSHINSGIGVRCRTTGVFKSEEACNRKCGAFKDISDIDICREFDKDPGVCLNFVSKYYFNREIGRCKKFSYGGCDAGPNMFSTYHECNQVCSPYIGDTCKLKYLEGTCLSRYVMWFYDETRDQCGQFIYTGCGGNSNRFKTLEDCENRCKKSRNV